jgi:hypothetical protein
MIRPISCSLTASVVMVISTELEKKSKDLKFLSIDAANNLAHQTETLTNPKSCQF